MAVEELVEVENDEIVVLEEVIPNYRKMSMDRKLAILRAIEEDTDQERKSYVISEAMVREIERRAAYSDAHPEELMDWEDFKKELDAEEAE